MWKITFLCEDIAFHIFWIDLCDFCQDSDPFSGAASTKAGYSEASCFCYKHYMQNILKFQAGFSFCPVSRKSSCLKRKTREPTKNYMSVCWEIHPRVSTIYTNASAVWFFIMTVISVQFSLSLTKPGAMSSVTNSARFT